MALSGLWEIPREAVYLDHEAQQIIMPHVLPLATTAILLLPCS